MKALAVLVASFLTCSALGAPARAQVGRWELTSACELLAGIGVYPGIDECVEALTPGTVVDNPDPVEFTEEIPPWEIEDLHPWTTESVPLPPRWLDPYGWCDDTAVECATACHNGCARRGFGVDVVQFRPNPKAGEKQCACRCDDPAATSLSIVCIGEEPRPVKPKPPTVASYGR